MTYSTYVDEGLERWILATAKRNLWRAPSWYTYDDLVQDGYACLYKIVQHENYGRIQRKRKPRKDDRRNFMTLVKTTFQNHITDLANARTEQRVEKPVSALVADVTVSTESWLEEHGSFEEAFGDLGLLIRNAPSEIKQVLQLLASGVKSHPPYQRKKKAGARRGARETTNEYLCRLVGEALNRQVDPNKVDMEEQCRRYFTSP